MEEQIIGYKKPPKRSQFKKGSSGNPAGRPKKSKELPDLLKEALDKTISIKSGTRLKKMSRRKVIAKSIVNDALQGDLATIKELLYYMNKEAEFGNNRSELIFLPEDQWEAHQSRTALKKDSGFCDILRTLVKKRIKTKTGKSVIVLMAIAEILAHKSITSKKARDLLFSLKSTKEFEEISYIYTSVDLSGI